MNWIIIIAVLGFIDITGRIIALGLLMQNGSVKCLTYKAWVLLCVFLNFAWVFYFILGRGKKNV